MRLLVRLAQEQQQTVAGLSHARGRFLDVSLGDPAVFLPWRKLR